MTAEFDQAFWDSRYSEQPAIWSGNPNPQLVTEAADLPPGRSLDVGAGEGADAIWLAQRGWTVTAVDISAVALQRAQAHARGQTIEWKRADLTTWAPPSSSFDLVSAQFMQLPPEPRAALFRNIIAAVAPGGTLLVVAHDPSDMESGAHRPHHPDLFYTAEDIAGSLGTEWEIVAAQTRPRAAKDREGGAVTIKDSVLRARRTVPGGA
ncbi:class I SAM-dependent methyltransferase [Arthrobacter sp. H5]|uniref:class I SAM-dependent methyltransferase n=1 Tax=Arthrobacter sp. H5 TaxID=1267973 RepID=UPI0004BA36F1|nr:class I SAM-dependent methyltransferase [Arthrobacter sp. H5]